MTTQALPALAKLALGATQNQPAQDALLLRCGELFACKEPAPSGSFGPSGDVLDESQGQGGAMEPDPPEDIR